MQYVPPLGAEADAAYVDAQPALGIEGSVVPAAAIEHPQREILDVIEAAELEPDGASLTQLRAAILALAGAEVGAHATRTDNPHAVTAAQLPDLGAATATAPGLVELATPAETQTGTDDTRAVTPAGLAAALGGLSPAQCRAWVQFDGSTSPPTIRGSYNVLGVTRHGVGDYTVSFVEPMPSAHYAVCGTSTGTLAGETEDAHGLRPNYYASDTPLTAGSVRVRTDRDTGSSAGGAAIDSTFTSVVVIA